MREGRPLPPSRSESVSPSASEYDVKVLEPGSVKTRPVPLGQGEFQQALQRLARGPRIHGEYWLARLLEREARGRYVQTKVKRLFEAMYEFDLSSGVDVVDPETGYKYEILSGTESNMARHGRRMAIEFFRMLTF